MSARRPRAHACDPLWHLVRGEDPALYVKGDLRQPPLQCWSVHRPALGDQRTAVELKPEFVQILRSRYGLALHLLDCPARRPGRTGLRLTTYTGGVLCHEHGELAGPRSLPRPAPAKPRPPEPAPYLAIFLALVTGGLYRLRRSCESTGGELVTGVMVSLCHIILWCAALGVCQMLRVQTLVPAVASAACLGSMAAGTLMLAWYVGVAAVERGVEVVARRPAPAPSPHVLSLVHGLRCAVCGTHEGPVNWVGCPSCETSHHADCWTFQDGCAVYGCAMAHGRWRGLTGLAGTQCRDQSRSLAR